LQNLRKLSQDAFSLPLRGALVGAPAMKTACIVAILALAPLDQAFAWGQEGHSIVAEIAQRRLDAPTLGKIRLLLKTEAPDVQDPQVSLASIASWADDYRADHPETGSWHFVDIPYDRDTYDPAVDCKNGNCVIDAIARFKAALADCSKSPQQRTEALKFLVHFVGDIHQPLHVADRTDAYTRKDDQGGNTIDVTFYGQKTNLHVVWDTSLIMRTVYAWGAYVSRLETKWLPGRDIAALSGGTPVDWALESHAFAHNVAYDYADGGILEVQYYTKSLPVLDRQLAVAGLRLARVLKEALQPTAACP
jgi:hypothetical protein